MYKAMSVTHSLSNCFTSLSSPLCYLSALAFQNYSWISRWVSVLSMLFFIQQQIKERTKKKEGKNKDQRNHIDPMDSEWKTRKKKKSRNDRGRVPLILAVEMDFVAKTVQIMFGIVHWCWANMKPSEETEKERKKGNRKFVNVTVPFRMGPRSSPKLTFPIAMVASVNNWFKLWKNVLHRTHQLGTRISTLLPNAFSVQQHLIHSRYIDLSSLPYQFQFQRIQFCWLNFWHCFRSKCIRLSHRLDSKHSLVFIYMSSVSSKIEILVNVDTQAMPLPFREMRRKFPIYNKWVGWCQRNRNEQDKHTMWRMRKKKFFLIRNGGKNFSREFCQRRKSTREKKVISCV